MCRNTDVGKAPGYERFYCFGCAIFVVPMVLGVIRFRGW